VEVCPAFCLIYIGVAEACKAAPEPRYADQPYTWRNWGNKSGKKKLEGQGEGRNELHWHGAERDGRGREE